MVDTFQMVRGNANEPSYGGDYQDMQKLKRIADQHNITVLLVHHLHCQLQGKRKSTTKIMVSLPCSPAMDEPVTGRYQGLMA